MPALIDTRLYRALVCLLLIHADLAQAGSAMLAAPVNARLSMSRTTGAAGSETSARLQMTLLEDIPHLSIRIRAKDCMDEIASAEPDALNNARRGTSITSVAKFRIRQPGPCDVIAEIVTYDDARNRFGSVLGVTVNPAPAASAKGTIKGVTANGERTLEAPASR